MKNRKCLLLIISLLFVGAFVVAPVDAKKLGSKDEANLTAPTAGVQGNEGETLKRVKEDKDVEAYRIATDEGKIKFKAIVDIFLVIRNEKENYCKSLSKNCYKGTVHEDDSNKLIKLKGNNKKQEEYNNTCYSFIDKVKNDDKISLQSIIEKQEQMEKMADTLTKEAKAYKDGNQDQPDVEPVESGYLESGDLVAWGIPGIPYIPTPRPKTTTTSSSSTSTPAQKQEISDEGYKSLRSIEMESEKVTEPEKDQFISELNSRVGSN